MTNDSPLRASPLRNVTFRKMFAAQIASLTGTGLTTIALALLAYDFAGGDAGRVLGTVLAIKMIAYVSIAPIAGGFANRLSRKHLLVSLDLVRAGVICCMPFITEVWQIYLLIFFLNICSAAFTPIYQAMIPEILPDDASYTRALSYSRLAYDLENLISPTLAALALLIFSYNVLFVVNAVTFILSALLLIGCRFPIHIATGDAGSVWARSSSGISAYLRTPRLKGLLALSVSIAAAGAMVIVNTVVYVRDSLGGDENDVALVLVFYGFGSMIVALTLPRLLDRFGDSDRNFMLSGGLLSVFALFSAILSPGFYGLFAIWFVLGVGSSLMQTPAARLLKRSTNENNRTQIYAAQFALSHLCWLVSYPLLGWASSRLGLEITFLIAALLTLAGLVVASGYWRGTDTVCLLHTHDEGEHEHFHVHDAHHQHEHEGSEAPESHRHSHRHKAVSHSHDYVIDSHHKRWPV
ncbi:MAG: MFS family permease [Candidatus Azotimanducaceae bacterium]|jgi:MFS family permease